MDLSSWLSFLAGCVLGGVLGYFVRGLREMREELDGVEDAVAGEHEERALLRNPKLLNVMLLAVVGLTVWASFASQRASNGITDTQDAISRITSCNQQYLSQTIEALNERTTYTQDRADSTVELQKAQAAYLNVVLLVPPVDDDKKRDALTKYFSALTNFIMVSNEAKAQTARNPYPTNEELAKCLTPKE